MTDDTYPVEITAPDIEGYRAGNTGVEFVTTFDSGIAGPHVMINAVTHGNEICGAIALDELLKAGVRPVRGKLTLGFINYMAYLRFEPQAPDRSRFVDEDFNRVWVEERLDSDDNSVELRRARELRPIFDSVDLLLDLHSMGTYSEALIICNGLTKERQFSQRVGFPGFIMCGSGHIVGKRLIEYTPFHDIYNEKVALLVECGQHWAAATATAALDTALHFLRAADVVDSEFVGQHLSDAALNPSAAQTWDVTDGITAQTSEFQFVEPFVGMEIVKTAGTCIANDGGTPILTPYDNCLLMMPNYKPGKGIRKLRLCRRVE